MSDAETPRVIRMRQIRRGCFALLALAAAVTAGLTVALSTATPASAACGSSGYTYAGLEAKSVSFGMDARVTVAAQPHVQSGHVAAWVGVGGPHQGPNGTDEWIQVGLSAFPGSSDDDVYYEVARPGGAPRYTLVESGVALGEVRQLAVLETAHRGMWRVWVDGRPVSPRIWLPGSDNRFRPIATTESWGGGRTVCNGFAYRFERIGLARAHWGNWAPLRVAYPIRSGGYRFVRFSRGFAAGSEPAATG